MMLLTWNFEFDKLYIKIFVSKCTIIQNNLKNRKFKSWILDLSISLCKYMRSC